MKALPRLTCLLIFMGISNYLSAANRFWVASGASNWNNTANWSASTGGVGGSSVPVAADIVTFDAGGVGNCTIDALVNVTSLTLAAGYTGTISQGANSIATSSTASFSGGTFSGGAANMTITGAFTLSGTAFTSTSATLELRDNVAFTSGTFIHNNGTVRFNCTNNPAQATTGTAPVFYALEFVGISRTYTLSALVGNITVMNNLITSGALFYNLAGGTIDVKGDINSNNTATGCGGDAMININGAGAQNFNGSTVAGAGSLTQLTINKAAGTLSLANFPGVTNKLTYTSGTISPGTSTFCFSHGNVGAYNIIGSSSFSNIEFPINTSLLTLAIAAATTLTATGDLTIAGAGNLVLNTGNINVNGNIFLTNTGFGGGGSTSINIIGIGAENMDGSTILANQSRLPVININKTSGTLSLLGNISFASNLTYTQGIINAGTSNCYLVNILTVTGSFSLYNLFISNGGNTTIIIAAGSTVTVTNTFDLENGANNININTGTIAVLGNIIDNNTSIGGGGNATILINGTVNQTITTTGVIDQGQFPGVTINKSSGTLVLPAIMTVRFNWTYITGTIDISTNNSTIVFQNTLNITGTHSLNNIIFNGTGNYIFTTGVGTTLSVLGTMSMIGANNLVLNSGNINLFGNLSLTNTSIGGGGSTVISFLAAVDQTINSVLPINQNALPAVIINKSGGTLIFPALITVRGSWTYMAGTYDVSTNNSNIVFTGPLVGGINITGTHSLNNVTLEGNNNNVVTVSTGTILTVTGTLTTNGAANVFINTPVLAATAIQAQGNININNTSLAGGGTGVILINGTGAQAFTSTVILGLGQLPYITIQKLTGTLTLTGIFSVTRNWTFISGTVDATSNASTVVFGWNNLTISSTGMNFYHVTVNSNTSTLANNLTVIGNLTINGTGVLAPGANTINLGGNWADRSTIGFTEATSTVNFNGSSLQTITTPGGENFTNLLVNNSGAGIQLENNVTNAKTLTMTQGDIDLNTNTLTLGTSAAAANIGTLNYTLGTIINTGTFTRWFQTAVIASGSASGLFPVGNTSNYQPFYISAPVAPTTGGTVSLSYTYVSGNTLVSFPDGAFIVAVIKNLNWALTTGNGLAGGTYSLDAQGTGLGTIGNVADLRLTLVGSVVATPGINAGTIADPQVNRTALSLANLTNTFYIGSVNYATSPLPLNLVAFTANSVGGMVKLDWETAVEINNDYFTIERSADGNHWENIQTIKSSGNSTPDTYYTAYDQQPLPEISFYRLQQTDFDGVASYSVVREISMNQSLAIMVYPNPASQYFTIQSTKSVLLNIVLLNSSGQIMTVPVSNNGNYQTLYVSNLKTGTYFIKISYLNFTETRKIEIEK